jgi:hypothetical protein
MVVTMSDSRLVPSLKRLREEFDTLAPHRDRGADGDVGDKAHRAEVSAHNPDDTPGVRVPREDADKIPEIHALDIDSTGPWPPGRDLNWSVEVIRGRHLRGFDYRLQNIIWRDRIASRSWGWTWEPRPGIGHYDHAHFECTSESAAEADTRPWGLLESINAGRMLVMEKLDGLALPILHEGDNDAKMDGYDRVSRAQATLAWLGHYPGRIDGIYGPIMVAGVKALGINNGQSITRDVWIKLYGLTVL